MFARMCLPKFCTYLIKYIIIQFKYFNRVKFPFSCTIGLNSKFEGQNVLNANSDFIGEMGYGSYIGADAKVNCYTKIGRFTSIGSEFKIITGRHPYTYPYVTTCPMFYSLIKQNGETFSKKQAFQEGHDRLGNVPQVVIGNDVWINAQVSLVAGVTINDGAVLLSGCVVTKDVPPYAIVGGIPAQVIKYRYSKEDIDILLSTKWWNKSISWLKENVESFNEFDQFRRIIRE